MAHRDVELRANAVAEKLMRDISRLPQTSRHLSLSGLDRDDLAGFVAAVLDRPATDGFLDSLEGATQGNPFFVGEVLHHLSDDGLPPGGNTPVRTTLLQHLSTPAGVQDLLSARFERLSAPASQLLTLAATIGRAVDLELIEALGGPAGDALVDAVEELLEDRFLVEAGGRRLSYVFAHDLVRQAAYERSSRLRRTRLHWRVGEELVVRRPDDLDAIAHHLFEGVAVGDGARALAACRIAGERAAKLGAPDRAARHFENALSLLEEHQLGSDNDVYDLLMGLSWARHALHDSTSRVDLAERAMEVALRLDDPDKVADAVEPCFAVFDGSIADDRWLHQRALASIPPEDSEAQVRLLTLNSYFSLVSGVEDAHLAALEEPLAMARRLDTESMRVWATGLELVRGWCSPDLEERAALIARNGPLIVKGNLGLQVGYVVGGAITAAARGLRHEVLVNYEPLIELVQQGHPMLTRWVKQAEAALALADGDLDRAATLVQGAFAGAGFDQSARYAYEYQHFVLEEARGNVDLSRAPTMGGGALGVISQLTLGRGALPRR